MTLIKQQREGELIRLMGKDEIDYMKPIKLFWDTAEH